VADVVYQGIVDVLKAPDGDRFIVIGEHSADNFIYDPHFLGWNRSPDFILIQVTRRSEIIRIRSLPSSDI
jgi:hypothetical protein